MQYSVLGPLTFWGGGDLRFSRVVVRISCALRAAVFLFPFRCIPVPRVTEAGDSRDLDGVTPSHRGEEKEARQRLRVQRRPLRTDRRETRYLAPGRTQVIPFPHSLRFFFVLSQSTFYRTLFQVQSG